MRDVLFLIALLMTPSVRSDAVNTKQILFSYEDFIGLPLPEMAEYIHAVRVFFDSQDSKWNHYESKFSARSNSLRYLKRILFSEASAQSTPSTQSTDLTEHKCPKGDGFDSLDGEKQGVFESGNDVCMIAGHLVCLTPNNGRLMCRVDGVIANDDGKTTLSSFSTQALAHGKIRGCSGGQVMCGVPAYLKKGDPHSALCVSSGGSISPKCQAAVRAGAGMTESEVTAAIKAEPNLFEDLYKEMETDVNKYCSSKGKQWFDATDCDQLKERLTEIDKGLPAGSLSSSSNHAECKARITLSNGKTIEIAGSKEGDKYKMEQTTPSTGGNWNKAECWPNGSPKGVILNRTNNLYTVPPTNNDSYEKRQNLCLVRSVASPQGFESLMFGNNCQVTETRSITFPKDGSKCKSQDFVPEPASHPGWVLTAEAEDNRTNGASIILRNILRNGKMIISNEPFTMGISKPSIAYSFPNTKASLFTASLTSNKNNCQLVIRWALKNLLSPPPSSGDTPNR